MSFSPPDSFLLENTKLPKEGIFLLLILLNSVGETIGSWFDVGVRSCPLFCAHVAIQFIHAHSNVTFCLQRAFFSVRLIAEQVI